MTTTDFRLNGIRLILLIFIFKFPALGFCSDIFIQCNESSLSKLNVHSAHRLKPSTSGYIWINTEQINTPQFQSITRESNLCLRNIEIVGQIENGDTARLKRVLDAFGGALVSFNSPGGDIYEAMSIGRLLSKENTGPVNTVVERNEVCASACVLAFAGGDIKIITRGSPYPERIPGGKLVIHRPSLVNHSIVANLDQEEFRKLYDQGIHDIKVYLQEVGIRPELAAEMMRFSSDEAHELSLKEIAYYGLDQENPYKYEKNKSWWIARCGQDWYDLRQSLLKSLPVECPINQMTGEERDRCWHSVMDPLYRVCGLELPKR
jgi:hypothetical protein